MKLNELSGRPGNRSLRKRVGRGIGSGTGKTAARGHKGQKSRSGVSLVGFEGGQMPLYRRLPKGGFKNIFRKRYRAVNVGRLQQAVDAGRIDAGKPIDAAALVAAGVIKSVRDGVRLLAGGEITASVSVNVAGASAAAVAAVEKAGGTVTVAVPKTGASKTAVPRAEEPKAEEPKAEEPKITSPPDEGNEG